MDQTICNTRGFSIVISARDLQPVQLIKLVEQNVGMNCEVVICICTHFHCDHFAPLSPFLKDEKKHYHIVCVADKPIKRSLHMIVRDAMHMELKDKVVEEGKKGRSRFKRWDRLSYSQNLINDISPHFGILKYLKAGAMASNPCKGQMWWSNNLGALKTIYDAIPIGDNLESYHRKNHPECYKNGSGATMTINNEKVPDKFTTYFELFQKYGPLSHSEFLMSPIVPIEMKAKYTGIKRQAREEFEDALTVYVGEFLMGKPWYEFYYTFNPTKSVYSLCTQIEKDDIDKGVRLIVDFLRMHEISPSEFAYYFREVLEGKKKKRGFYIYGISNTGKTFFAKLVKEMLGNACGDLVASKNFKYEALAGKIMAHIEEFDPKTIGSNDQSLFKKLLEGESALVDRKYSKNAKVDSVPFLITSNYPPREAFKAICRRDETSIEALMERIHVYEFRVQFSKVGSCKIDGRSVLEFFLRYSADYVPPTETQKYDWVLNEKERSLVSQEVPTEVVQLDMNPPPTSCDEVGDNEDIVNFISEFFA